MYLSPYENNIFVLQFVFQNLMIFTHLLHVSLVQKIKKKLKYYANQMLIGKARFEMVYRIKLFVLDMMDL
jgi:hypothetical protein